MWALTVSTSLNLAVGSAFDSGNMSCMVNNMHVASSAAPLVTLSEQERCGTWNPSRLEGKQMLNGLH